MTRLGFLVGVVLAPLAACSSVGGDADLNGSGGAGGFAPLGLAGRGVGGGLAVGGRDGKVTCDGPGGAIAPAAVYREPSGDACSGAPARLPRTRSGLAATTADDGRIYLVGGWSDVNTPRDCQTPTLIVYDPATNVYRPLAEPPVPLRSSFAAATVVGNTLVVSAADIWRYDIPTDIWTPVAQPFSAGDALFGALVSGGDGKAYLLGGTNGNRPTSYGTAAAVYDVATDRWEQLPSMPTSMNWPSAVAMGGRFYVVGDSHALAFERPSATWTVLAGPTYHNGGRLAADGAGQLLYMGGDGGGIDNTVQRYDPATKVWTTVASLPSAAMLMGVASGCGGRVFVFGGQGNDHRQFPSNGINDLVQVYAAGAWTLSP